MKKLMKLMVACAAIALCGTAFADPYATTGYITTALNTTVFTNTVVLDNDIGYKAVEKLVFKNSSTSTGTVVIATSEVGVFTTIATATVDPGSSAIVYPVRAFDNGSTTNTPYICQKLRLITTLNVTNAVASKIDYVVYSK